MRGAGPALPAPGSGLGEAPPGAPTPVPAEAEPLISYAHSPSRPGSMQPLASLSIVRLTVAASMPPGGAAGAVGCAEL
jgi:hypothetical protein